MSPLPGAETAEFNVHLTNFTGPFDLLLHLISKHKLDVTEVALSQVTDDFVAHIKLATAVNGPGWWDLDQSSSFIVVAATLLDLKAAAHEGQQVSVSSLCIAAAVPPTTALRWITAMTKSGMLLRHQDPSDALRVFIELSTETSSKLDDYFMACAVRSAPII